MRKALSFIAFFFSFTHFVLSQVDKSILDKIVAVDYENVRSDKAVKLLSHDLGCGFSYDASLLKKRLVNIESDSSSVRELLYSIFDDSTITIAAQNRQILIYKNHYGQQHGLCDGEFVVSGKIIDGRSLEPVPYSAIKVNGSNQHTVANDDGVFVLKLPCQADTIEVEIYALGYLKGTHILPISVKPLSVFLSPTFIALQEVIIRSVEPKIVLKKCLERIHENYTTTPANATVFFRETVQKNDSLVGLVESIFKLYKEPYNNSNTDKLKLIKGRKFIDKSKLDTVDFKMKGALNSCLLLDVVKNLPSFLKVGSMGSYEYKFVNVLNYNNKLVYKIDFAPQKGVKEFYYRGSLFFDEQNYALVAVEFEIPPSLLSRARANMIFRKSGRLITKPLKASYVVHFKEISNRYFLSYVQMDIQMRVRQKGKLFASKYRSSAELVVNKVEFENVQQITRQEIFNPDKIFLNQPIVYDINFWKGFGFLPLDKSLLQAVQTLEIFFDESSK